MRRRSVFGGAVAAFCVATSAMGAITSIDIVGDTANSAELLGDFSGSIVYDSTSALLSITLSNTSPAAKGGLITGVIFNFATVDLSAAASLGSTTNTSFLDAQNQSGVPFGSSYIGGAALGGDFLGGGMPTGGIGVSDSDTFEFNVTATDSASLTASSFLDGPYAFDFVVRFRGFKDGGSDEVPAMLIPGPAAIALFGVAGVIGVRGRRRR